MNYQFTAKSRRRRTHIPMLPETPITSFSSSASYYSNRKLFTYEAKEENKANNRWNTWR